MEMWSVTTERDLLEFFVLGLAFCGAFTLVVALTIPLSLFSLYSEKYTCIIEEMRRKAGNH